MARWRQISLSATFENCLDAGRWSCLKALRISFLFRIALGRQEAVVEKKLLHNQGAGQWHPTNKTGATGGPESFFWEAGRRFYFEKCEFDIKFTGQRVGQWHPINIFLFKTDHWGPESFFREAGRRFYTHPISFFVARCPNNQCLSLSGLVGADPFNFIFERQGSQIDWKSGSARDGYASEKEMGGGHI